MRSLVVHARGSSGAPGHEATTTAAVAGVPLAFSLRHDAEPTFDADHESNRRLVLIRTRAFSLNYRDRAVALTAAQRLDPSRSFPIGSDFVGHVLACGRDVATLRIGDRVMPNPAYPDSGVPGLAPGLPTNSGSIEVQPYHEAKLMRVPEGMPDEVAAAFSIGGQTSYSMIRRLALKPDDRVLVTAARSNTSLFVLQALRQHGARVVATTTSERNRAEIEAMGAAPLVVVSRELENFADDPELAGLARAKSGFTAVVDPFSDLHLPKVLDVMAPNSRYTTCGVYDQHLSLTREVLTHRGKRGADLLMGIVTRNVSILGNCLGTTEDLARAAADCAAGLLRVTLDSVHHGRAAVPAFVQRTFEATDRFGKVVYVYD
jgi:NADPH:quinone reductase-like Zn-dependent oxidoreductase